MKRAAVLTLAALAAAGPATAQGLTAPPDANPAPPRPTTTFEPTGQSMSALLDKGYKAQAVPSGSGIPDFLLHRDRTWVLCHVTRGDRPGEGKAVSDCVALN